MLLLPSIPRSTIATGSRNSLTNLNSREFTHTVTRAINVGSLSRDVISPGLTTRCIMATMLQTIRSFTFTVILLEKNT